MRSVRSKFPQPGTFQVARQGWQGFAHPPHFSSATASNPFLNHFPLACPPARSRFARLCRASFARPPAQPAFSRRLRARGRQEDIWARHSGQRLQAVRLQTVSLRSVAQMPSCQPLFGHSGRRQGFAHPPPFSSATALLRFNGRSCEFRRLFGRSAGFFRLTERPRGNFLTPRWGTMPPPRLWRGSLFSRPLALRWVDAAGCLPLLSPPLLGGGSSRQQGCTLVSLPCCGVCCGGCAFSRRCSGGGAGGLCRLVGAIAPPLPAIAVRTPAGRFAPIGATLAPRVRCRYPGVSGRAVAGYARSFFFGYRPRLRHVNKF